jgi:hypothetical protein
MDGSEERAVLQSGVCGRVIKGLDNGRMVRPTHHNPRAREIACFHRSRTLRVWFFPSNKLTLKIAQCPHFQAPTTCVRDSTRHRTLWHFVFCRWPRRGWRIIILAESHDSNLNPFERANK